METKLPELVLTLRKLSGKNHATRERRPTSGAESGQGPTVRIVDEIVIAGRRLLDLRALLGYDKTLCSEVLRAFTDEVGRSLRRRAKKVLGLVSVSEAHTGGITICQRFDSALRPGVHFHPLFLDGVHVECDDGSLEFHELPEPSP